MSIPQRVYVYLAAFISFAILLQGAYGLATDTLSGDTFNRATWLAMVIVGLPVWLAHELLVRRAATRHADETASTIRKLYVHGALALAALYVFFGAYYVVEGFAEDLGDNLENIGGIIVAGALWYYIWRRENLEGQPGARARTVKRWRVYGLSLIFLTTAVAGTYWITYGLAYAVYNAVFAPDLFVNGGEFENTLRTSAGWAIVGAAGWVIQWRAVADSDEESVLRRAYLYGFAVHRRSAALAVGGERDSFRADCQAGWRGRHLHNGRIRPAIHPAHRWPHHRPRHPRLSLVNHPPRRRPPRAHKR